MINVVIAELRKLRRPTLLLSTLLTVTVLSGLFTSIVFLRVGSKAGNGRRGETITAAELSHASGFLYGFKLVGTLLGLVALCVFASQMAQEYTYGTLRNLLVRQPSRMKILVGKFISMTIFAIFMVLLAGVITISLSYALAGHAKVNTLAWSSGSAMHLLAQCTLNIFIQTLSYGLFGMILGILFRSPISAIATGVIWSLILETILGAVLSSTAKWLPAANFSNIGEGGTMAVSYQHSLLISVAYLTFGYALVSFLFKRRDVAN
jgi:ABC-2 type transport system permease protein